MPPEPPRPLEPPPRPMVWVALAHLAGLALGLSLPAGPGRTGTAAWGIWWVLLIAALAWSGVRFWRSRRVDGPLPGAGRGLLLALALIGWAQGSLLLSEHRQATAQLAPWLGDNQVRIEGTLDEEPNPRPVGLDFILRDVQVDTMDGRHHGRLRSRVLVGLRAAAGANGATSTPLTINARALPLPGQRVQAWGKLRTVGEARSPEPFNAVNYSLSQNIGARLTVTRPADLKNGPPGGLGQGLYGALRALREAIGGAFARRLPAASLPLARALFLGEQSRLAPTEQEAFNVTSLTHLLAVSGLHTSFVLLIILGLARALGLTPRRCAMVGMAALVAYLALTGFRPPVMRATVMGLFMLTGFALGRVATGLAALATATFVTLLIEPRNLLRLDWQLTYLCMLALLLVDEPVHDLLRRLPGALRRALSAAGVEPKTGGHLRRGLDQWLLRPLSAVCAIQLLLLPLQVCYFRQFNLLLPLHNLVGVLLSFYAMCGLTATALLGWVPGLGALAGHIAAGSLTALERLVTWGASLTATLIPAGRPALGLLAAYYGLMLSGSWLRTGEGEHQRLSTRQCASLSLRLLALAALMVWLPVFPRRPGGFMDFYMLDVGQGDSLVTRFPNGKLMVVDGGPAPSASGDQGRLTVGPFLKTLSARRIDLLAATHADADHIGGLPWLVAHWPVGLMLEGPDTAQSELFAELGRTLQARRFPRQATHAGADLLGFEPARVRLLGPVAGEQDNNASVAMLLSYGAVDILLTGDLEAEGERRLLAAGALRDIEVLKLGHHGSRTSNSEAFLRAVRPEIGLISVGRHNRYGHPAPPVLRRLAADGVEPLRTDQLGTVWLHTDGRRIQLYRFAGP